MSSRNAYFLSARLFKLQLVAIMIGLWCVPMMGLAQPATAPHHWASSQTEDGSEFWLRYRPVEDEQRLAEYRRLVTPVVVHEESAVIETAVDELVAGLGVLLDQTVTTSTDLAQDGGLLIGTTDHPQIAEHIGNVDELHSEGFIIRHITVDGHQAIVIASPTERGALYGAFALLREMQLYRPLIGINKTEEPATPLRVINMWDNPLDHRMFGDFRPSGSIDRGYAGGSILWKDNEAQVGGRQHDYARMLAAKRMNGIVINNVNVTPAFLRSETIEESKKLADLFREYGIRVYFCIDFASPIELSDSLDTADPNDPDVQQWWNDKVDEIHTSIPDFGGFLVKANSEGMPGPEDYGATHAEGANMLARALEPIDGICMWRAFPDYSSGDRAALQFPQYSSLDGQFDDNVYLQIKNGPLDFQPLEPVSPLFGQMPETNLILELQITEEYLANQRHVTYMGEQWRYYLDWDTQGHGHTEDELWNQIEGIAAVSSVGTNQNWFANDLSGANNYLYGELAWDPHRSTSAILEEWTRMTFGHDAHVVDGVMSILDPSFRIYMQYSQPYGMSIIVDNPHHYWFTTRSTSYMRWDGGVGYDRTSETGSGMIGQYPEPLAEQFESIETTPKELLLFFHQVPYDAKVLTDRPFAQDLYDSYYEGVQKADELRDHWLALAPEDIGQPRYDRVMNLLRIQSDHARIFRDTIVEHIHRQSGVEDQERRIGVSMSVVRFTPALRPGEEGTMIVEVNNNTDEDLSYSLTIDQPATWSSSPIHKTTEAGESDRIELILQAPDSPFAGTKPLVVKLTERNGAGITRTVTSPHTLHVYPEVTRTSTAGDRQSTDRGAESGSYVATIDHRSLPVGDEPVFLDVVQGARWGDVRITHNTHRNFMPHHTFQGLGYANYLSDQTVGSALIWRINVSRSGTYDIGIRYALASASRSLEIHVDDEIRREVQFQATGNWRTWRTVWTSVELEAGAQEIRLYQHGDRGPNVDGLIIRPEEVEDE